MAVGEAAVRNGVEAPRTAEVGASAALLAMILLGSTTATAAKFAVRELPVGLLPLVRFGVVGICLLPWTWRSLAAIWREDKWRLLAASTCCVPINQNFFLNGTKLAPTSHVGLIYAATPLVVLVLATMLGQERMRRDKVVGVVLSVLGIVVIGLGNLAAGGQQGADGFKGDMLLIGAVVSWGAYLTFNKPLVSQHGSLPVLAATFLVGSLLDLPIAVATMPGWHLRTASATAWAGLAHMAIAVSLLGLTFQNIALRKLDASRVATVGNVAPLLTILWGVLLLGEPTTGWLVAGAALTLGGVLWSGRRV